MLRLAVVLGACALLASCASELKRAEADLETMEGWLPGRYDNVEQAQEDAKQGRTPHAAQSLSIVAIHIPTFGDHVFYLQESAADDARRVTTQRLLSFTAVKEGVLETLYTINQPGRWRDGHLNPDLFKGMMYNDATPLAGCDVLWKKDGTKFVGANPSGGCRATMSALGGGVRLTIRTELLVDELAIAEQAFNASGQLVMGDAAEPFYRYRKRQGP